MSALPAGWPAGLPGPDSPAFPTAALEWLFELCPWQLRAVAVLRRHPVLLARLAAGVVGAQEQAMREQLRTARVELSALLDPPALAEALAVYEQEAARLALARRGVAALAPLLGAAGAPRLAP